jgi:hypothetical protein
MLDEELIEQTYHFKELDQMAIAPDQIEIEVSDIKSLSIDYLAKYVRKALSIGRFQDYRLQPGCGRSNMEIEWAYQINRVTGKPVLIIACLVAHHYLKDIAEKGGIEINFPKSQEEVVDGINVVNYEKLKKFDPAAFIGIASEVGHLFRSTPNKKKWTFLRPFFELPTYHFLTSSGRTLGIMYLSAVVGKIYRRQGDGRD